MALTRARSASPAARIFTPSGAAGTPGDALLGVIKSRTRGGWCEETEPVHHDRLGVTELPRGVASIRAHQIGDLGPERQMLASPLLGVHEAFSFVPGDVVPDEVQRNDSHSGRLHDAVRAPGVVHQRQALPDLR